MTVKCLNFFTINDWEFGKFSSFILAVHCLLWNVIFLEGVGYQLSLVRSIVGFLYLTFVPGFLILRILKFHHSGNIRTFLYCIGLSISFIMFSGFFMNVFYPFFGISDPLSFTNVIITLSFSTILLFFLSYFADNSSLAISDLELQNIFSPNVLFLCLIPFLSVFGTYLVNFHQNNILQMVLICVLGLIVLFATFEIVFPRRLYPLIILITSISLLFHNSLISMHMTGWDSQFEYYYGNLVINYGSWDSTTAFSVNNMLSVSMLAPIYSEVCNLDLIWVFKIIYPLFFSLVPLGLYEVFKDQTNDKISFLACFFLVTLPTFYTEMVQLNRQQIAEFFLVLLTIILIDNNSNKVTKSILSIIFCFSLVVSHYGLSYIYMYSLIFLFLVSHLLTSSKITEVISKYLIPFMTSKKFSLLDGFTLDHFQSDKTINKRSINFSYILLFIVFTFSWYIYLSSSINFISLTKTISQIIVGSFNNDIMNPNEVQALSVLVQHQSSIISIINKFVNLVPLLFISLGILTYFVDHKETKVKKEYLIFSYSMYLLCLLSFIVPHLSNSLNTSRLFQISTIFLSPFCIIGGLLFFKICSLIFRVPWGKNSIRCSFKLLSIFFIISFLLNSGLIYEIIGHPNSVSLNSTLDYPKFNEQEVLGAKWIKEKPSRSFHIYSDDFGALLLRGLIPNWYIFTFSGDMQKLEYNESYIYLRSFNVMGNIKEVQYIGSRKEYYVNNIEKSVFFKSCIFDRNKIYNNGNAHIYV